MNAVVLNTIQLTMLGSVVFFFALVAVTSAQSTEVAMCTASPGELPINTYIEGCSTPPCVLPQLEDCVLHVVFRAPRTMRSMTTLAVAYMSFGPLTFPVNYTLEEQAVTCDFLTNTYCPVLETEVVQYTLRMFIEAFFPVGTQTTIEFRVVDENHEPVFCLRVPVRISDPLETKSAVRNSTPDRGGTDNFVS